MVGISRFSIDAGSPEATTFMDLVASACDRYQYELEALLCLTQCMSARTILGGHLAYAERAHDDTEAGMRHSNATSCPQICLLSELNMPSLDHEVTHSRPVTFACWFKLKWQLSLQHHFYLWSRQQRLRQSHAKTPRRCHCRLLMLHLRMGILCEAYRCLLVALRRTYRSYHISES